MAELGSTGRGSLSHVRPESLDLITAPVRPGLASPIVMKMTFGLPGCTAIPRTKVKGETSPQIHRLSV